MSALTFDAGVLARGWLATTLAAGNDEEVPVLYKTLLVEAYDDGVRLTATDRYMLLTAWLPTIDADPERERGLDEAPDETVIVRDPDGRGRALLSYLRKAAAKAAKDEMPAPRVVLRLNEPVDDGEEPGFPGMELRQVVIDYPDHEKLALPIVQGDYPSYRTILVTHKPEARQEFALAGEYLARAGQVGKIIGGFVRCIVGAERSMVAVEVSSDLAPTVRGGIMPIALVSAVDDEDAA